MTSSDTEESVGITLFLCVIGMCVFLLILRQQDSRTNAQSIPSLWQRFLKCLAKLKHSWLR